MKRKNFYKKARNLTERQQEAVELRQAGCTFSEMAKVLGITQVGAYLLFKNANVKLQRQPHA